MSGIYFPRYIISSEKYRERRADRLIGYADRLQSIKLSQLPPPPPITAVN